MTQTKFPDPRFSKRLAQLLILNRHWSRAQWADDSTAGEMAHCRDLLERLGIAGGYVVDIAAGDGVTQSSTLAFFRDPRWTGLAVEMSPDRFAKLAFAYAGFPGIQLAKCIVTPRNVLALFTAHGVPQRFEFLNLDIDSYDLLVLEQMLKAGFAPTMISMEINECIPPPLYFTVTFDPSHSWQYDHFFGCSAAAASAVVKPYGYVLESILYNNAFFVRADAAGRIPDQDVADAYRTGYVNRPDRHSIFSNNDVEQALTMSPVDAETFFRQLFAKYSGKFELR